MLLWTYTVSSVHVFCLTHNVFKNLMWEKTGQCLYTRVPILVFYFVFKNSLLFCFFHGENAKYWLNQFSNVICCQSANLVLFSGASSAPNSCCSRRTHICPRFCVTAITDNVTGVPTPGCPEWHQLYL